MPNDADAFDRHLDFWLRGQQQGFAGNLQRTTLTDGSKMVALHDHPHLYVDRWHGSDSGGGQTLLYVLSRPWNPDSPLHIAGTPICRLG